MLQCIVGSIGIIAVLYIFRNMEANIVIRIFVKVAASAIVYFALQIAVKNQAVTGLLEDCIKKIKAKGR